MPEDASSAHGRDESGAEREDPASGIGTHLAEIRSRQGVRVSELARSVGVSPSLISQIERGQSRPSVSTLFLLAEALRVPVDAFFREMTARGEGTAGDEDLGEPGAGGARARVGATARGGAAAAGRGGAIDDAGSAASQRYLVHRSERAVVEIDGGVRWERLTPTTLRAVDFLELVYQPHAESHPTLYRHPGTEMVLVLSGELAIHVAFERYDLLPGDSICFPSTVPHRYVNPSDGVTRAVTVILLDDDVRDDVTAPLRP